MPNLDNLDNALKKVPDEDWELLFGFIPQIEANQHFGEIEAGKMHSSQGVLFPYWKAEKLVENFTNFVNGLDILPEFDWQSWIKGLEYLDGTTDDIETFKLSECCMLLTQIFRTNRFTEGYLIRRFEDKTMAEILKRMKSIIENR